MGLSDIRPGDVISVSQRIKEGETSRLAKFEGVVIARKHGDGIRATMTVRKIVGGIGVERIFPLHLPTIDRIEVLRRPSRVRRAKLYFIRTKAAKAIRKKMKHMTSMIGTAAAGNVAVAADEEGSDAQAFLVENVSAGSGA